MTDAQHKSTFFRQSGWMMIATVGSGVLMSMVHVFSKKIPANEYAAMGTLIQLLNWMAIPALGLQMVFAQQTSAVITEHQKRQLVGTMRAVTLGTFCIWLVMVLVTFFERDNFVAMLKLSNPAALWVTVLMALGMLWLPIFQGLLQGRQNFLWLGWLVIFNGIGRVFIAGLIVFVFAGLAAGIMVGALIGTVAALAVALCQTADLWREPSDGFDAGPWLKRVLPLTLGFGASQFLFSADALVVQSYLGNDGAAAPYVFGGTLARAIVLFTGPLAAVMFPKLVHSAARAQKTNIMGLTLIGTAVLSILAAIGLTFTAPLLIRLGSTPDNLSIIPLIPLFAFSMVPLGVANVLLNNLMAHSRFKVVPALVVLVIGYWIALQHHHDSFKAVIQTFGLFTLLFLAICACFTWVIDGKKALDEPVK